MEGVYDLRTFTVLEYKKFMFVERKMLKSLTFIWVLWVCQSRVGVGNGGDEKGEGNASVENIVV